MKVVFRVDASARMGTGHLMRCLTLAEALRERGTETRFICREHLGHLIHLLQQQAMPVTVLPASASGKATAGEDYAAWLGVSQADDAQQTIEALDGDKPDWLVVDHYGIDVEWEQRLRPHIGRLMVIDDLANRPHDCDVLLDQNYSAERERRYLGLVPDACELLVGPRYALLRPEYAAYRRTLRVRDGQVGRVLVFFGGSDPQNMTGMALDALSQAELRHLEVDVVVGANSPHRKTLEKQAEERQQTAIYGLRPHLADLMAGADLAIGAGGTTTWERMCLGLPSVVVSIAENQRPACEALSEARLIAYAGHGSDISTQQLAQSLQQLSTEGAKLVELVIRNQHHVDGLGAMRTAEVLMPSAIDRIRLRPAREDDVVLYYNWANDPDVPADAIDTSHTTWAAYRAWFTGKLHDLNCHLFVLEASGLPVGQIQIDKDGEEARINYSLDMIVRDRRLDSRLVAMGARVIQGIEPLRPRTSATSEDEKGRPVFLRMDSNKASRVSKGGASFAIAILSDQSSWINEYILELMLDWLAAGHRVLWVHDKENLRSGEFCFYLSCSQMVPGNVLSQFRHNLVVHESDLPRGRGWSPLTWQIIEGKNRIPVTLFEATEKVDSGVIYSQEWLECEGHELIDELREALAWLTLRLCKQFVAEYPHILREAREQTGDESFYRRRGAAHSEIDPTRSIQAQFGLLRVVDNKRYPAFFVLNGHRYLLRISKAPATPDDSGVPA